MAASTSWRKAAEEWKEIPYVIPAVVFEHFMRDEPLVVGGRHLIAAYFGGHVLYYGGITADRAIVVNCDDTIFMREGAIIATDTIEFGDGDPLATVASYCGRPIVMLSRRDMQEKVEKIRFNDRWRRAADA